MSQRSPSRSRPVLRRLAAANEALCAALDRRWPPHLIDFWNAYEHEVAGVLNARAGQTVVDVGAGKVTPFARRLSPRADATIIGVDALEGEMAGNRALRRRIVRDVAAEGLPPDLRADLVVSRMVLEHLPDNERFARSVRAALRPGGSTIHLFAARHSVFAIVNRLLPHDVARRVLFSLRPELAETAGFRTYYDRTSPRSIREILVGSGFEDVHVRVNFEVAQYLRFLFPLYVLGRLWERLLISLDREQLAAFVLISARRPGDRR